MDAEIKKQLDKEKLKKNNEVDALNQELEEVTNNALPMSISLYRQYLEWFTSFELERIKPTTIPSQAVAVEQKGGKDSANQLSNNTTNTTKAESTAKRAFHELTNPMDMGTLDVQMSSENQQQAPFEVEEDLPKFETVDEEMHNA